MGTANWGFYIQGSPRQQEIEEMGSTLSMVIDCPVHYPAYEKRMFECVHNIRFPVWQIEGYGWAWVKQHHMEELTHG